MQPTEEFHFSARQMLSRLPCSGLLRCHYHPLGLEGNAWTTVLRKSWKPAALLCKRLTRRAFLMNVILLIKLFMIMMMRMMKACQEFRAST